MSLTTIPKIDNDLYDLVKDKKIVIYTPNKKGEMPNTFNKGVIPSSIPLNIRWFMGYTNIIMEDFNMFEISEDIAKGLQSFNIINGIYKRYDQYFVANPDNEKLQINMSDDDIVAQIASKKVLITYELSYIYNNKFNELYRYYGSESNTWNLQIEEAQKYLADTSSPIDNTKYPILNTISTSRNIDIANVAQSIIDNNNAYIAAVGTLLGQKYSFKDKITSATTNEELNTLKDQLEQL